MTVRPLPFSVALNSPLQGFFGFAPNFTASALNVNGDDALELFFCGVLVDSFGNATHSPASLPPARSWAYADGWAARVPPSSLVAESSRSNYPSISWRAEQWDVRPGALSDAASNAAAVAPVVLKNPEWRAAYDVKTPAPTPLPRFPDTMPTVYQEMVQFFIELAGPS